MIKRTKKEEPAMSNKFKKVLAVALFSAIGLTACNNEVHAKSSARVANDTLITFTDSNKDEIYHNLLSIIEDAYRDGSLSSAVLDKVLYQYAVSVFGRYNKVAAPYDSTGITLKEAATDDSKTAEFIEKHKAYWTTDENGNRLTDAASKESEVKRVKAKWQAIEDRIAKDLYGDVSGGAYSTRGKFSEKKYLQELTHQLRKVKDYEATGIVLTDDYVRFADIQEEDVFGNAAKGIDPILHRENYQDVNAASHDAAAATYIEDEVVPAIYRSLLVEQYLLDESYNILGRSFARKVNVIAISDNANNDKAANYLMKYFVRNVISGAKGDGATLEDFKKVNKAMRGVYTDADTTAYINLVNAAYPGAFPKVDFTGYDAQPYSYYVGTDYGDMMSKFEKIKTDINLTDSSAESDFTGSYAYEPSVGLEIKTNEIYAKDYITDGWFIKDGGLGELPDTIKTRLFNIGVANVLDNANTKDRFETATYAQPENESKLVAKINGKYYLKVASKQSGADLRDDILFYESGKYYVVQIEEAVSSSKLDKENNEYKKNADGVNEMTKEQIINEVARVVGSNDKYQTLSTKHWLEKCALKYHDTKVYDYFKENYPDLF